MKKIVFYIFNTYYRIIKFLKTESMFGIRNSGYIIFLTFIISGVLSNIFPAYGTVLIYFSVIVAFSIIFIFSLDSKRQLVVIITKGEFTTPHQFLKEFTHRSFLYCLFVYSSIISNWIFFLKLIVYIALNLEFAPTLANDFLIIFVIVSFCLSFLYFCYQIYYKSSQVGFETIKTRLQLYTAIISSVTFLLWCFGLDAYFKLFLSGLALVFSWLQYILSIENKKHNEN